MVSFKEVLNLIREQNAANIRIEDVRGKRILDILDMPNVNNTIAKLEEYENTLAKYGRIDITAANEKILRANWQGAYHWTVLFRDEKNDVVNHTGAPHGYMSAKEFELQTKLHKLELQMEFDKKMLEHESKSNSNTDFDLMGIISGLATLFGKEIPNFKSTHKHTPQIAGGNTMETHTETNTADLQARLDIISANLLETIKTNGIDKIEKLIQAIKDKPHLVDMALKFI